MGLSLIQDGAGAWTFREELIRLPTRLSGARGERARSHDVRAARVFPALLLIFAATLGLLPHVFTCRLGELASFESAYDGEAYALDRPDIGGATR